MMADEEVFVYSMSPEHIKSEPESGDELEVLCRLCNKVFASCMALQNHARIVHTDAYETGNPKEWVDEESPKKVAKKQKRDQEAKKREEILSRIRPTDVSRHSAEDVSYIIIKEDEPQPPPPRKRKRPKKEKEVKEAKVKKTETKKDPEVITGPFECLETSTFGVDGTCHQMFFSCCEYSEHQLSEHARPRRRAARCQVCERPLSQLHQTGPKDFTCEQCLEGFDNVNELLEHKNLFHFQKKRFACSVCQKRFSAQGGVIQHMRLHTGDRPYSCTFCPKAFTQKSGLEQHIRTHTKVKPFRCVICSKSFIQTVHLKQHMRTHTNVTPFQCIICEKRFKQASHLNYHLKNHPANMTDEQKHKYRQIVINHERRDQLVKAQAAKTGDEVEGGGDEAAVGADEVEEGGDEVEGVGDEVEGVGNEVDGGGHEVDGEDYEVYETEEESYPNVIACEVVQYGD